MKYNIFASSFRPLVSFENLQLVNSYLKEIEVLIDNKVVTADSLDEYLKHFNCSVMRDAFGNIVKVECTKTKIKDLFVAFSTIADYLRPGCRLFFTNGKSKKEYSVRSGKLARIFNRAYFQQSKEEV